MATRRIVEGDEGEPLPIRRPRRRVLERRECRRCEPARLACRPILHVYPANRDEGDRLAISGRTRPTNEPGLHDVVGDAELLPRHLRYGAVDVRRERNRRDVARRHFDAAKLAALRDQNRLAVGRPLVAGEDA